MSLSLDDRLELADLSHRYAAGVDDRLPEQVVALFTPDGVLATARPPRHLDPVDEAVGTEQIAAAFGQLESLPVTQHAIVGIVLDPGSTDPGSTETVRATGRVACIAHHVLPDRSHLVWHLTYRDRYRRTDDGWRIERRELLVNVVEQRALVAARGLLAGGTQ